MRVPMIALDVEIRQFADRFAGCFSRPHRRHFVIVLAGLLLAMGAKTLTALLRTLADGRSLAALSRFLTHAPWSPTAVLAVCQQHFAAQVAPLVAAEQARQRAQRPRRRGRPPQPVVTGYLIGDDSTMDKRYAATQQGLGQHHSTTAGQRIQGHSLVQGLYVVGDRQMPLAPQLYRQQAVAAREDVAFQSKIALMAAQIAAFVPLAGTQTHVLLDSWYAAKVLWTTARERGFLITTGLRSNRWLRVDDAEAAAGWRWVPLSEYAAALPETAYQRMTWPGGRAVAVHVLATRVRKLYRCQVVIVRSAQGSLRYWASSDLTADVAALLGHIAARWQIEQLFADTKELLGLDQYQVMAAEGIVRWWTLVLVAYTLLEEERARLRAQRGQPVTLGEARQAIQHRCWIATLVWVRDRLADGHPFGPLVRLLAA